MRGRFEAMIRQAQNNLCTEVEALDGGKFHEDAWTRPGGGGGVSRVLQVRQSRTCHNVGSCFLAALAGLDRMFGGNIQVFKGTWDAFHLMHGIYDMDTDLLQSCSGGVAARLLAKRPGLQKDAWYALHAGLSFHPLLRL